MAEHPIQGLMSTAMESIKEMVDVNTIVGDAVQAPDGTVIIPISRVSFGFAAGGGEYGSFCRTSDKDDEEEGGGGASKKYPFAGGSGAGVCINPVAFMVVGQGQIRLLPVNINSSLDKIIDLIPDLMNKIDDAIKRKIEIKKNIKTPPAASETNKEEDKESDEE